MGDRVAPEHRIRNGFPLLLSAGHLAEVGMKTIFKEWILPLFLAGGGLVIPKDHLVNNIIGYSLILSALIIFIVNIAKRQRWFSFYKHSIFPWHQGSDVMRRNGLSHHELLHLIEGGLSAYPPTTDVHTNTGSPTPLNEQKIHFLGWNKPPVFEQEIDKLWFKDVDVKEHIK